MNDKYKYKTIPPFKMFCLTNFPFIEADFDALTNYELLCKITEYINNIGVSQNEVQKNIIDLNTWFDNLDVQDEIDKKLDEMTESGQLQEIIANYLNSKALFGFDTVSDLKSATNLIDGSYARTLGYYDKEDKGGALYKITSNVVSNNINILDLNNGLKAILVQDNYYLKANQVGIKCDGSTDSTQQLQNVINFCKDNNLELLIEGYVYVTASIDTKGISIKGVGKRPVPTHTYTSKKYGYIGWDYLRNTGNGALITFQDYVTDILDTGSGIISDVANPILKCNTDDGKFILEDLSIVGWIRNENQIGLMTTYSSDSNSYISGKHMFKNLSVFNCGNTAIKLQSLELTHVNNIDVSFNFGYGIYIEEDSSFDCPFEYTTFNQCRISGNKMGGLYAKNSFRKSVEFNNCLINRNGLYRQLNITPPSTLEEMVSGITINGRSSYTTEEQRNFTVHNCHGEEQNCMVKILDYASGRVFNNITIRDCILYPSDSTTINAMAYIDTYFTRTFSYYNNVTQSTKPDLVFSENNKNIIPSIVDRIFYQQYTNTPTLTISSKITVTKQQIYKYSNMIFVNILGETTSNISAYENIVENLPVPIDVYYPNLNVNNSLVRGALYTDGHLSAPIEITSGNQINIVLVYYTNYQS